jgi:ribosomal protein S18 acetylase RimI-like enzyme
MNLTSRNVINSITHIDVIFDHIDKVWTAKNDAPGIRNILDNKLDEMKAGKIKGIILFDKKQPKGLAWVDKPTKHYGNMILHTLDIKYQKPLVKALVNSGLIDGALLELVIFEDTYLYDQAFKEHGLITNLRQRMAWFPPENFSCPELSKDISFTKMAKSKAAISAELSYDAHLVSKDYIGYPDLDNLDNRIALEKAVFDGLYGPIVEPASLFIRYKGKTIGSCLVLVIKCWGYEEVPWIFDLVINPEYQGKGFGKKLLYQSLSTLIEKKYPIIGLAVTLSNKNAIKMYENIGFSVVEIFSEYAYKTL